MEQQIIDKKYDEKFSMKDLALIKNFIKYLKPYLGSFIFFILMQIAATFVMMAEPLIWGDFLNNLNKSIAENLTDIRFIIVTSILYLLMYMVYLILYYFCSVGFQRIGQNIVYDIRIDIFNKIEHLSIAQLNSLPIGKYVTRVTNDTQNLSMFFTDILVSLFRNVFQIISVIIYCFITSWQIALVIVAFIPVIFVISYITRIKAKRNFRQVRNSISELNAFMSESLSGMKTIQIFNQELRKGREFDNINNKLKNNWIRVMKLWAIYYPSIYVINMICVICVFAVGVPMIINSYAEHQYLDAGTLFSMYLYTQQLSGPVTNLANLFNRITNILSSTEKVYSVLSLETFIEDSPNAKKIEKFKGEIEFKNVYFAYIPNQWVLKNVSFKIKPGETCAFVGATGAGKSTIISLIVRNYDIQKGEILIDGINIKDIQIESLRKGIGQMLQDVFLFSGNIEDNIKLDNNSISHEEVVKACQYVGADTFIEKLPNKYNEIVRERGNNFSAGQRQLISFARVMVYKPQIVVLDEATANIDTETEVLIQDSLNKMRNIGTMIIVAHRLSTIKNVDTIYVLDHGEIIEQGNHSSLIDKHGLYYRLYKLQNMQKEVLNDVQ